SSATWQGSKRWICRHCCFYSVPFCLMGSSSLFSHKVGQQHSSIFPSILTGDCSSFSLSLSLSLCVCVCVCVCVCESSCEIPLFYSIITRMCEPCSHHVTSPWSFSQMLCSRLLLVASVSV